MSKTDGIGVLSLSLDFLHVRRWVDASLKGASATPVVCVAVNFDDPHPITSSIVELPSGEVSKRDAIGETELWHGLRLTSLADILHVELRGSPTGPTIASYSAPVTSLLEDAFLESDTNGVKAEFNLDAEGDETLGNGRPLDTAPASFAKGDDAVSHTAGVAHTQFRVKYHRQIDILRALCDGVGIDVASVDSMKEYAPQAVSVVKGADGLVKARRNSLGRDGQTQSPSDSPTKVTAFDVKAAAQEREESALFRKFNTPTGSSVGGLSYASLTAGVRRFIAKNKDEDHKLGSDRGSNLVRLLSDAR